MIQLSGDGQKGCIHQWLAAPIAVQALRSDGSPWARKLITFEVIRSDGRLAAGAGPEKPLAKLQVRTDEQGSARAQ